MGRVKTFSTTQPAGNVTPANLNSIQDDYESVHSAWVTIGHRVVVLSSGAQVTMADPNTSASSDPTTSDSSLRSCIYLAPTDAPRPPRVLRLRVRGWALTNAVAPGANVVLGLARKLPPLNAASAFSPQFAGGAVYSDVNVTLTTPAANTLASGTGAWVDENRNRSTGGTVLAGFEALLGWYELTAQCSGASGTAIVVAGAALQFSYA